MRLRLNGRAELTAMGAFGSIEAFEKYLNQNQGWMFRQNEKRFLNGKWVTYPPSIILLIGNVKLVLSKPIIACDGKDYYYNRIITILQPNRNDRADALAGNEVQESIEVEPDTPDSRLRPPTPIIKQITEKKPATPSTASTVTTVPPEPATEKETKPAAPTTAPKPSSDDDRLRFIIAPTCPKCETNLTPGRGLFCQQCALKLPPELAVHPEIVVALKRKDYDKLATHLKQAVNAAWCRLMKGRKIEKTLCSMGQNIFMIIVADEARTSTLAQEEELNDILTETGIGRVTSDLYEICKARKMLNNKQHEASD
jgi:hypothetical protein